MWDSVREALRSESREREHARRSTRGSPIGDLTHCGTKFQCGDRLDIGRRASGPKPIDGMSVVRFPLVT